MRPESASSRIKCSQSRRCQIPRSLAYPYRRQLLAIKYGDYHNVTFNYGSLKKQRRGQSRDGDRSRIENAVDAEVRSVFFSISDLCFDTEISCRNSKHPPVVLPQGGLFCAGAWSCRDQCGSGQVCGMACVNLIASSVPEGAKIRRLLDLVHAQ